MVNNECAGQTALMRRLLCVFVDHMYQNQGFARRGPDIVSEYDQEISQSETAEKHMAS